MSRRAIRFRIQVTVIAALILVMRAGGVDEFPMPKTFYEHAHGVSMTMNAHYVPRFLTRPWELDNRMLACFDFSTSKLQKVSSRRLFAIDGLNSAAADQWFSRLESKVAAARARLGDLPDTHRPGIDISQDDLNCIVALMMIQLHRSGTVLIRNPLIESLDAYQERSYEWLESLAVGAQQSSAFAVIRLMGDILFPEGAFFHVPLSGHPDAVQAFPIDLDVVLVRLPRTLSQEHLTEFSNLLKRPANIVALSAGVGRFGRRVLIPPSWLEALPAAELRETLLDCHNTAKAMWMLAELKGRAAARSSAGT